MHPGAVSHFLVTCALFWGLGGSQRELAGSGNPVYRVQSRARLPVQAISTGQTRDRVHVPGKAYLQIRGAGVAQGQRSAPHPLSSLVSRPSDPLGGGARPQLDRRVTLAALQPRPIPGVPPQPPSLSTSREQAGFPSAPQRPDPQIRPHEGKKPRQLPQAKGASQRYRPVGPNVCGGHCCSGWTTALGTGRCIKPVCAPPCQNKGSCSRPNTCVCRSGFRGPQCEHVIPEEEYRRRTSQLLAPGVGSLPRTNRYKNNSTPAGDGIVQRPPQPSSASSSQKMADMPVPAQQHTGSSRTVRRYPSGASQWLTSNALPNGHEQEQVGSSLQKNAYHGRALTPWGMNLTEKINRIKIVFTPTICKQTCQQGHCYNYCEKGHTTTLYSQAGHNSDPKTGFRIYFCQIPCLNGGRCVGRDECWCPSNSTGKFCHLAAAKLDRKEVGMTEAVAKPKGTMKQTMITLPLSNQLGSFSPALANVHIDHPPEANVQVHQVARVQGAQSSEENSVEIAFSPPDPPRQPGHGHDANQGRWNGNSITGGSGTQLGVQDTLGTCFLESLPGKCGHPLPGLSRQEDCCGSVGTSWGFRRCTPCPPKPVLDHPVIENGLLECPPGYKRLNGTHCQDIDECLLAGLCTNAECLNTRGSYRCACSPGYMLDASQRRCVSDKAMSDELGMCFRSIGGGICSYPLAERITKQLCCCSRVGKAWGRKCEKCPLPGTDMFKEICPAGHGYTYSRDDIQLTMRETEEVDVSLTSEEREAASVTTSSWVPPRQQLQEEYDSVTALPTLGEDEVTPEYDQCAEFPSLCGAGTCLSTADGYTCLCNPGFRLNTGRTRCIDVNECENPRLCRRGRCINTPGSYRCVCERGYARVREGHCEDVDECRNPAACPEGSCINTPGSFECLKCPEGYTQSGGDCHEEDECADDGICQHGVCLNMDGSYRCSCYHGYEASTDGKSCRDIDECKTQRMCREGVCVNTDGSFTCTQCPAGYKLSADRGHCEDVDECSLPSACPSGICTNTLGSYTCLPCETGYTISVDRLMCTDIDECAAPTCHGGDCINTLGSYTCHCPSGFELENGTHCEDVNECLRTDICGPNGECLNSNGSYFCLCTTGYSNAAGGVSCEDVDECNDRSICSGGQCLNTEGSFRCVCDSGFRYSAETHHCEDADECSEYGEGVCGSWSCQNTLGSYRCLMGCQSGYQMAPAAEGGCADIDECVNDTLCGRYSFCENTEGSYRCLCDRGYELNPQGLSCIDVNECELMVAVCGMALCENVEGSFLCLCINDNEEYNPENGRCQRRAGSGIPEVPAQEQPSSPDRKECYYNINHQHLCENVLAKNTTKAECCCTEGAGWGDNCETHPCPIPGTVEFSEICPSGKGYIPVEGTFLFGQRSYTDADECAMFGSEICRQGQCVNTVPGYTCFCQAGHYYDSVKLECVDHDECGSPGTCENGECVNLLGSYHCFCSPPLVLDATQKRCDNTTLPAEDSDDVDMLDMHMDICWQRVESSFICSEPLQGRRTTYTECCCLYGEAWSQQCALCPPPASVEFAELCNLHRGGSDPEREAGLRDRNGYEYGPDLEDSHFGLYEPDSSIGGPYYNYLGPEYVAPDSAFGSREQGRDVGLSMPVRTQFQPEARPQVFGSQKGHYEGFEGLRAEECGILNGCENGRCVRVREGYTCDCFDGFELELTKLACIDINECEHIGNGTALCQHGQCENTEGSYRCVCSPGYIASQQPHQCVPQIPQDQATDQH